MTEFETSTRENNDNTEIQEIKTKKNDFWWIFAVIVLTIATVVGVAFYEICKLPFSHNFVFGDTNVTINANYNSEYKIIKIDLLTDEIVEDWQVTVSDGKVDGIKLICENEDKSLKRDFQFEDIALETGKNVETSFSIENSNLKDFLMIKDLLSGDVSIQCPQIINLDSSEREKLKQYYESGSWIWGLLWTNMLMGGY